jgi:predicted GNAT family acetyltransferase
MRVVRESAVVPFLERVGAHLRAHPAESNLMLGLLCELARAGVIAREEAEPEAMRPVFLLVEGARGSVEAVAMQTPPRALIVSRASERAVDALVEFVRSEHLALGGVVGPAAAAERFASVWGARAGCAPIVRVNHMLYELDRVRPPATCPGMLREATPRDENILAEWSEAFTTETAMDAIGDCLGFVRKKMAERQLFVWANDTPACMAAWMGRTDQGVRIGYVYTPRAERKKGYASALVAALSQRLLDKGVPRCFLFTDAANPTSNRIYRALGYERVCDFRLYDFPAR